MVALVGSSQCKVRISCRHMRICGHARTRLTLAIRSLVATLGERRQILLRAYTNVLTRRQTSRVLIRTAHTPRDRRNLPMRSVLRETRHGLTARRVAGEASEALLISLSLSLCLSFFLSTGLVGQGLLDIIRFLLRERCALPCMPRLLLLVLSLVHAHLPVLLKRNILRLLFFPRLRAPGAHHRETQLARVLLLNLRWASPLRLTLPFFHALVVGG